MDVGPQLAHARTVAASRFPSLLPGERFAIVYRNQKVLGWVFCTGLYPDASFAYITLDGRLSMRTYALRQLARRALQTEAP